MTLAEIGRALRLYAEAEHGKRSGLHAEIVREIFRDPAALANEIEHLCIASKWNDEHRQNMVSVTIDGPRIFIHQGAALDATGIAKFRKELEVYGDLVQMNEQQA